MADHDNIVKFDLHTKSSFMGNNNWSELAEGGP